MAQGSTYSLVMAALGCQPIRLVFAALLTAFLAFTHKVNRLSSQ